LKNILDHAFRKLNTKKCKRVILVLGNTGCGKSTLLSSFVVGSKKLEMIKIKEEFKGKSGKVKKMIER